MHLGLWVILIISFSSALHADDLLSFSEKQRKSRYEISSLNKIISRSDFDNLNTIAFKGEAITVDTQNKKACDKILKTLKVKTKIENAQLNNFCSSKEGRFVSLIRIEKTDFKFDGTPTIPQQIEKIKVLGVGVMGAIASLPEDESHWDDDILDNAVSNWERNIRAGPVLDKDDWEMNLIGHPLSGAAYYIMARQTGLESMPSFGFSVLMSTFFWEYGLEAIAESPSIQDLIITPTLGALIGEQMYSMNERIKADGNKLFGSKQLGKIGLIITDPVEALIGVLRKAGNNKYVYDGDISWGTIPFRETQERYKIIPGVTLRLKFRHR